MKVAFGVACLLLLIAAHAAEAAAPRKLLQRGGRGNRFNNNADAQFARNQAAAINTQQAIRAAEASGANQWSTRAAANTGSANAWLAAQGSDWVYGPNAIIGGRRRAAA